MLKLSDRLNLKQSFKWVRSGTTLENNLVKVHFRFSDNPSVKVGIATASQYFKKAVDRNRARRLISKAMEDLFDTLPKGLNIILLPKTEVLKLTSTEISAQIRVLLEKIPRLD